MPASTRRAAIIQRLPAFCAPLKKKRRWAPGRLVAEPRGSRFSGARAIASPCGDDWRHGVAAESLEVLRRQTSDVDVGSNDSSYPYWLGTWLRGLYAVCTGRPASDNCPAKVLIAHSDFEKMSLWVGPPCTILWLGWGGRQGLVSPSKWCSRPLFGMAVSVHTGGYPSQHGATLRHIRMLAAARSSRPPAISR